MDAAPSDRVRQIASARDIPESEVIAQAIERGVESLYRDVVLSQYLGDELDRAKAVELVGEPTVRRVEAEMEAVTEDLE
jgi:hypothetical protein